VNKKTERARGGLTKERPEFSARNFAYIDLFFIVKNDLNPGKIGLLLTLRALILERISRVIFTEYSKDIGVIFAEYSKVLQVVICELRDPGPPGPEPGPAMCEIFAEYSKLLQDPEKTTSTNRV